MSMINRFFPREVMLTVFNYLTKEDQVTFSTVCRVWNRLANYTLGDLRIKVEPPNNCCDLWQDIVRYKTFGPGIACLTIDNRRIQRDESTFSQIIAACPNLIQLKFTCEFRLYGYLKRLNHPITLLPNIQRLHSMNMEKGNPSLIKLYLLTNFRYRETLTSLSIWGLGANEILNKNGGLIKFLSNFPKLNRIKVSLGKWVYFLDEMIEIDLAELIETISALRTLEIYHYKISINPVRTIYYGTSKATLEHLKLDVSSIDIICLDYIKTQMKCLDILFLRSNKVKGILPTSTTVEKTFEQFTLFCKRLQSAYVHFKVDDFVVNLKQGGMKFDTNDIDTDEDESDSDCEEEEQPDN